MIEQTMLEVTKVSMESWTQWQNPLLRVRTHIARYREFVIMCTVYGSGETCRHKTKRSTELWRDTAFSLTGMLSHH